MVEKSPAVAEIRDEGGDVWSLWADGVRIGYMTHTGAAQWWHCAWQIIPMLLDALEETLTARDVLLLELHAFTGYGAMEAAKRAGVPLHSGDWTPTTGAAAAEYLRRLERGEDEPF